MANGEKREFFVVVDGKSEGPFSLAELAQHATAGRITPASLAWRDGMRDWQAASSIAELQPVFRAPQPAPQPSYTPPPQQAAPHYAPQQHAPQPAPQHYQPVQHQPYQQPAQQPYPQQAYQPSPYQQHPGGYQGPPPGQQPYPGNVPYAQPGFNPGLYADFGQRFISGLIDGLIFMGVFIVVLAILAGLFALGSAGAIIGGILAIPLYLSPYVYLGYFMSESGGGQTIGDRVAGFRTVVEQTGQPMPVGKAIIWLLVYAFVGFIGWIWILIDPKQRALHNIATETVAIRTK